MEIQCLVQGSTVGLVPALVTQAQVTSMRILVKLTTPLTRSSVIVDKATLVNSNSRALNVAVAFLLMH